MEEILVKNMVIGKQYEMCENYKKFIKISKEKNINIKVVEKGQMINIENNLTFNILWPCSQNIVNKNIINNNSMVCKLVYNKFSMLFTGDIEEVAENEILSKYNNFKLLKSTILKVAHHGSRYSSSSEFLAQATPAVSLISCSATNRYGHPGQETLERLQTEKSAVRITKNCGAICLWTDGSVIKLKTVK